MKITTCCTSVMSPLTVAAGVARAWRMAGGSADMAASPPAEAAVIFRKRRRRMSSGWVSSGLVSSIWLMVGSVSGVGYAGLATRTTHGRCSPMPLPGQFFDGHGLCDAGCLAGVEAGRVTHCTDGSITLLLRSRRLKVTVGHGA